MKLIKKIFILLTLSCLFIPLLTLAQETEFKNPLKYNTFKDLVEAIIRFFFWVAIALAPLFIIIGALYFLTSGGDPKRIETGKNIILYTCVGLVVIMFAWGLIALVQGVLGVVE